MANRIDACAAWNAQAVACLLDGQCNECIEILKGAMAHSRATFQEGEWNERNEPNGAFHEAIEAINIGSRKLSDTTPDEENLFSFFSYAFAYRQTSLPGQGNVYLLLVILLYNIGLAQQMKSPTCPPSLKVAARFYQSAWEIASRYFDKDCFEKSRLLLLAVGNNLGHIHCHLQRFGEMKECVTLLKDIISYPSTNLEEMSTEAYEFFALSAFCFLDGSALSVAPAA